MKCVKKYFLCCYLIASVFSEVGSIKNYPVDKNLITQEDRRGAEKLEDENPIQLIDSSFETKKRGLGIAAKYHNPGSLLIPSIGLNYERKRPKDGEGYESHRTASVLATSRPHYSITDSRGGYIGNYPNTYNYPGEYSYGGGFSHSTGGGGFPHSTGGGGFPQSTGGGVYSHSGGFGGAGASGHGSGFGGGAGGGGGYEYPVYGPPSTGIGHTSSGEGGGFKNSVGFKKLLLPLAGLALLGAAAALTVNPVLLQLGVINGRRRRRGLLQYNNDVYPPNHFIQPHHN